MLGVFDERRSLLPQARRAPAAVRRRALAAAACCLLGAAAVLSLRSGPVTAATPSLLEVPAALGDQGDEARTQHTQSTADSHDRKRSGSESTG